MKKRQSKAQSFIEYAVLIAVAAAALIAMRVYLVRAVQEKYRQSADVFGQGEQYARGVTQVTESASSMDIAEVTDPQDVCANIRGKVAGLEKSRANLLDRASKFAANAASMRQQAQLSQSAGFADAAKQEAQLLEQATDFEKRAQAAQDEAAKQQEEIDGLKKEHAECFE